MSRCIFDVWVFMKSEALGLKIALYESLKCRDRGEMLPHGFISLRDFLYTLKKYFSSDWRSWNIYRM